VLPGKYHLIELRDGDEVGNGLIEYGAGKGFAMHESMAARPPI
jgi:hypothetical protein